MRITRYLSGLLLLCSFGPAAASGDWMPTDCRVELSSDKAHFSFPAVYEDNSWTWFQRDTSDDALEYSFEVMLKSGTNTRGVGFYLFKLGGMQPVDGGADSFFNQGRVMAWTKVNQGRRLVPVSGVKMQQQDKRIILEVNDRAALKALLGAKPRAALFSTLHPDPQKTYGCLASVPVNSEQAAKLIR